MQHLQLSGNGTFFWASHLLSHLSRLLFQELCPSGYTATNRSRRKTPSVTLLRYENAESIQVHDYVKIMDNTDLQGGMNHLLPLTPPHSRLGPLSALRRDTPEAKSDTYLSGCFDRSVVVVLLTVTAALLTALICVSMYAMYLLRQRKQV